MRSIFDGRPIVVGTDFSAASRVALDTAWTIATSAEAPLLLVHVYPGTTQFGFPASDELRQAQYLDASTRVNRRLARPDPLVDTTAVVREGDPGDELAAIAEEVGAGLLVIGASHTPAPLRWLTGSVTADLLERLPCDLLIADCFAQSFRRVLVAIDAGSAADAAIAAALSLASATSEIDVVDVSGAAGPGADELIDRWRPACSRLRLVDEIIRPADQPPRSHHYDLIAMAAGKRSWLERLLSRDLADELTHDPPCSILVVSGGRRARAARGDGASVARGTSGPPPA